MNNVCFECGNNIEPIVPVWREIIKKNFKHQSIFNKQDAKFDVKELQELKKITGALGLAECCVLHVSGFKYIHEHSITTSDIM